MSGNRNSRWKRAWDFWPFFNPRKFQEHLFVQSITDVNSISTDVQQFYCPIVSGFDFGIAIEELYPILSIIFSYLPFKDLKNAAKVNNIWDEYVNKELSKRRYFGKFKVFQTWNGFEFYKNSTFDDTLIKYGLLFGNFKKLREFHSIKFQCNENKDSDTDKAFGPNTIVYGYLAGEVLPVKERIICIGLAFSMIPNLFIEEYSGINFIIRMSQAFERSLQLKALIYLCDQRVSWFTGPLKMNLRYLTEKQKNKKIALAGGLIHAGMKDFFNVAFNNMPAINHGFHHAIAFLSPKGDDSFEGYSIVIQSGESFGRKLAEAKADIVLKKHSIAILFHSTEIHIPEFLEKEFHYHFPTVDLTYMTVNGEIGWDSYVINGGDDTIQKKKCKSLPNYTHVHADVVLFLSWD